MKKGISALLFTLVLAFAMLGGCTADKPGNTGGTVVLPPSSDPQELTYKFEIVEKDSFYFPTISGKVAFNFYPERITVSVQDMEEELTPASVVYVPAYYEGAERYNYIFSISEVVIFPRLQEGTHNVVIYGYDKAGEKTANQITNQIYVKGEMFACGAVDFETGETLYCMDLESNWIGPY